MNARRGLKAQSDPSQSGGRQKRRIASAEVDTMSASAGGRAWNRRLIASKNGNPLVTGAGAVSLNEKAPSASWAKPWLVEKNPFNSRNKITYMGPYWTICTIP